MKLGLVVGTYAGRVYVEAQGKSSCVVSERASADAGVGMDAGSEGNRDDGIRWREPSLQVLEQ